MHREMPFTRYSEDIDEGRVGSIEDGDGVDERYVSLCMVSMNFKDKIARRYLLPKFW